MLKMESNIINESSFNIAVVCRTCLKESNDMKSLYEVDLNELNLLNLIVYCSGVKINEYDGLPSKICIVCYQKVILSYNFKQQCIEANNALMNMVDVPNGDEIVKADRMTQTENKGNHINNQTTQTEEVTFQMCEMCDSKFITEEALRSHRTNHKGEQFQCRKCPKGYSRLNHLQRHISISHPEIANCKINSQSNDCKICNKQFNTSGQLRSHECINESLDNVKTIEEDMVAGTDDISTENVDSNNDENESSSKVLEVEQVEIENFVDKLDNSIDATQSDESSNLNNYDQIDYENTNDCNTNNSINTEECIIFQNPVCVDINEIQRPCSSKRKRKVITKKGKSEQLHCDLCKKNFPKHILYRNHMEEVHEIVKIYKCEKCPKMFARVTHLRRHEVTHLEIKPYKCDLCEKRFTRLDHLNLHMVNHSDIKPYSCDVCQRGFTRAEHMKKHKLSRHGDKNVERKEICTICKKRFTTANYLQIHMKIHTTQRTWNCKFCPEKFNSKPELNEHQKNHVNERPFLCSECGLRFVRNDYLVIHMRRHKGEKPYKCKFCGKGFPRATDLTVHERYHTGEKSHLCTTCGKGFQRAYNLLVHTRVHTGERPYKCPHCDKRFAQGNDLKSHVRRHTGERYNCDICSEGFIQGYHLTQHKRNVHGIDMKSHIRRVEKFITPMAQEQRVLEQKQNATIYPQYFAKIKLEDTKTNIPKIDMPESTNLSMLQQNLLHQEQLNTYPSGDIDSIPQLQSVIEISDAVVKLEEDQIPTIDSNFYN